ncbi:Imm1 family immunity protein [Streptomyces sp. NPDC051555]|uniref:Imm1 family immunity protein n=1 Tax=Streptomyces sp. NPDC051555 TaxID=3365657 RepID=UPI0037B02C4F
MTPNGRWHLQGSAEHAYSGEEARQLLRHRWDWANQETWFENDAGRLLGVVTNGERAMVVLLDGDGDPGEHLVDPRGEGSSGGYRLSNGQADSYEDRDTVAFDTAAQAVAYFIEHGTWPSEVTVQGERAQERS